MTQATSLYWIRLPEHTDMFTQGYVGVSRNIKKRWNEHQKRPSNIHLKRAIAKYGWDNLIKQVILIADEAYCFLIEAKLRAEKQIGWNVTNGGGNPPNALGKKFGPMPEATKLKVSQAKKGHRHTPKIEALVTQNLLVHGVTTRFKKGIVAHNKGVAMTEEQKQHYKIELTCPHCNKVGKKAGMNVWHMNNCRFKELSCQVS